MTNRTKLLYVDDEIINLDLFQILFKPKFDVVTALSGEKGLELLDQDPGIPIVISDMKMPKMNGIEFIRQCREKHPRTTFFILTGYEITGEIRKSLDSGLITNYFRKPFDANAILTALQEAENRITKPGQTPA